MYPALSFFLCLLIAHAMNCIPMKCTPENWCANVEMAKHCDMLEFCQKVKPDFKEPQKVTLELYYESFCPGCKYFITYQLYSAYAK